MANNYGTAGNDTIYGTWLQDWIYGFSGNDFLYGFAGGDYLFGHDGHDWLFGGHGSDRLFGGSGNDFLYGEEGHDWLWGDSGNDYLNGGDGQDRLNGGTGNDVMYGGDDRDTFIGGAGADYMDGGADDDTVDYSASTTAIGFNLVNGTGFMGDAAGDTYVDIEKFVGTDFNDIMVGDDGDNEFDGGAGDDVLNGGGGQDVIYTGTGNDVVYGGDGLDYIRIGDGFKTVDGGADGCTLWLAYTSGTEGWWADLGTGSAMQSWGVGPMLKVNQVSFTNVTGLSGGVHDDVLIGDNSEFNRLESGRGGDDFLFGKGGRDVLIAQEDSRTTMHGGTGKDLLVLQELAEFATMTGGSDADIFRFRPDETSKNGKRGEITDFNRDEGDRIDISGILDDPAYGFTTTGFLPGGNVPCVTIYEAPFDTSILAVDFDGDSIEDWHIEIHIVDGQGPVTGFDLIL